FVFLAISLSLLGLGAAGTWVAVRRPPEDLAQSLVRWLGGLLLSIVPAFLMLSCPWPVTNHSSGQTKLLGLDAIAYLLWCAPALVWLNFAGGVVLGRLFASFSQRMSTLYAADLGGAGLGCLAALVVMRLAGPPAAFVAPAALVAVALLALGPDTARLE